jgi:hypothetical protein
MGVALATGAGFAPNCGPRLDLAIGRKDFALTASETALFGYSENSGLLWFRVDAGVAWGAPFVMSRRFGATLDVGYEWFSDVSASGGSTISAPSIAAGLRLAQPFGVVSAWLGADFQYRLSELELGPPIDRSLPRVTTLLSLGAFMTTGPAGG